MLRTLGVLPALFLIYAADASAQDWTVDQSASAVGFETEAFGSTARGEFADWTAEIRLDPDNLDDARIRAVVMTGSGATGNGAVDEAMLGSAGLAPEDHSEAVFVSEDVRRTEAGYAAHGQLQIKGTSRDVVLPFTLEIDGDRAVADGHLEIARTDFGVGDGSWGETAAQVSIVLHIEAEAAD